MDKPLNDPIIERYQQDEKMMILIFAQWCINHEFDPDILYKEAYPQQLNNHALNDVSDLTVPKSESDPIPDETVLNVLQLFGNHDLAMIVQQKIEEKDQK